MNKVINVNDAAKLSKQLRQRGKTIVLAGGCFDILHPGHIKFLEAAKKEGDVLFVLLESDENVKRRKGENRPVNNQQTRAKNLSNTKATDYIVNLKGVTRDEEYDRLMFQIRPGVVAMTRGDENIAKRQKQCQMAGAKLKLVIDRIEGESTTSLINKNG